jgi:hypothetical protein
LIYSSVGAFSVFPVFPITGRSFSTAEEFWDHSLDDILQARSEGGGVETPPEIYALRASPWALAKSVS